MSWRIYDEPIDVLEFRYRYFPQVFRWRGHRHQIEAVERCWTVSSQGWKRTVSRHYFHVRSGGGVFELFQDVETGLWGLRRANLVPARPVSSRRVATAWR